MTTLAAILGALPLAARRAEGAEMRQPLGLTIIGGCAQPGPDPLHHPGGLPLSRPPAPPLQSLARRAYRCCLGNSAMTRSTFAKLAMTPRFPCREPGALPARCWRLRRGPDYQRPDWWSRCSSSRSRAGKPPRRQMFWTVAPGGRCTATPSSRRMAERLQVPTRTWHGRGRVPPGAGRWYAGRAGQLLPKRRPAAPG